MPNSFNLFLGKFCFTAIITIQHYSNKWYEKLLMIGMKKIIHTKNDLTLKSYLKMINENNLEKNWKNLPLIKPKKNLINSNKFKVGISLSAGNKMKTIDNETWKEIFKILDKFNLEIYIFGLENEKVYLDKIKKFNSKNRIISLLGKISLEELPFYISQTNLYISSDTGNSYIADSFKIPLINFAGPCYMQEQRPIGKDVLVIESNAKCVPFSFIFKAPYETKCNNLYKINEKQEKEIEKFITKIYKEFRSS
jgi:ADP-heptose:LPS heptosyltransferase